MNDPLDRVVAALSIDGAASSDFDLSKDVALPKTRKLRAASVLCAFQMVNDAPHVILTKRSSALRHHPGQIAFPGGKQDPEDDDAIETALREAKEEIGLTKDALQVLGTFPAHETVTGFLVTPVFARLTQEFTPTPEIGEVAEVFTVPLSYLSDLENYQVESRRWRGQRRHYYVVPYGPYYVWGATARILRGLADRMARS